MRALLPFTSAVLALSIALTGVRAHANGRFPTAQQVVIGPGSQSDVVVLRVTFGLLISRDGGRTFAWMCEDGMYYPFVPGLVFDPSVEVASSGRIVFGYEDGIRSTLEGCTTTDATAAQHRIIGDITSTPSGDTVYAIESAQGNANAVYRADGATLTFARMGAGIYNVTFYTIEVAPSRPSRLYLSGRDDNTFAPVLYTSDDGGQTLTRVALPSSVGEGIFVSAIDPNDPDTLYVRAEMGLGSALVRLRDRGTRAERLVTTPDPMLGFAISSDGRTIWVGSIQAGLLRSDDGGGSFMRVNTMPVLCLRQHAGALWMCTDWLQQPFALGRSMNGGETFTSVLRFEDIPGPAQCMIRGEGAELCDVRWPMQQRMLADPASLDGGVPLDASTARDVAARDVVARDVARVDVPADRATTDAGNVTPPVTPPAENCQCRAGSPAPSSTRTLAWGALLALAMRRRQRRV
jgi:MYXO-CTERM domain-containing protein